MCEGVLRRFSTPIKAIKAIWSKKGQVGGNSRQTRQIARGGIFLMLTGALAYLLLEWPVPALPHRPTSPLPHFCIATQFMQAYMDIQLSQFWSVTRKSGILL
jgi:hypothetical protein